MAGAVRRFGRQAFARAVFGLGQDPDGTMVADGQGAGVRWSEGSRQTCRAPMPIPQEGSERMLKDSKAFSTFAVKDTEAARRFYAETLGLDVRDSPEEQAARAPSRRRDARHRLPEGGPYTGEFHGPQLPGGRRRRSPWTNSSRPA